MNANELLDLGNELTRLNSDHLAQKCVDDNDVQNYVYDSMDCLERSRVRKTAEEAPTAGEWILFLVNGIWEYAQYIDMRYGSCHLVNDDHSYLIDPEKLIWFYPPQLPEVTP